MTHVTDADINRDVLNAAVHKAPDKILHLGSTEGEASEWEMSDLTSNHDMRMRIRNEEMQYFCKTCEDATQERTGG